MDRYYDLVLGLIPLAFVSVTAALAVAGLATPAAVTGGSLVAVGLVGHAMFVNGPVDTLADTANQTSETSHQPAD